MSIDIEGTTTMVCSSWLNDSIERQSGTSFCWRRSNCCAASIRGNTGGQANQRGTLYSSCEEHIARGKRSVAPVIQSVCSRPESIGRGEVSFHGFSGKKSVLALKK